MSHTTSTRRNRRLLASLMAMMLLTLSADAFALDGYQDRRGLFTGIGIGGGIGLVEADNSNDITGIDSGRKLGLHLHAIVGGGATDNLIFGAEANWWIRTVQLNDNALSHHHMSFNGVLEYFLFDVFYLEGGVGLAYAIFDAERRLQDVYRYQELGVAVKAGAGFEFFVNSQIAIGMRAGYTRHFYSNGDFDTVSGGLSLRWY